MSENLIRDTKLRQGKKLPELEPTDFLRSPAPAPPAPLQPPPAPAPTAPVTPTQPDSPGFAAGGLAGAVATGQVAPPPPAPSLDPFAPVVLGNDAIQPVPVTYEGQTPAQVVQEALTPSVQQGAASDAAKQGIAAKEIASPPPEYQGLYNPPDWNTVLGSGIYEPTFTNQAQIQADPSLGALDEALGGLLSTIRRQNSDSSVGGAFDWVTNAFSKDGSRSYVRSVYRDKDGTYRGNFLGGALYGLGLLWNAPAGAVIDAKNVGSNIFNKFAPQWVKSSAGATYRWAAARAPVIGALLDPWTKRDPYNDGKSNFIEALRGAQYSFGDEAGKGFGIKREETLGNIPGTTVPFNPTAVLGFGLDVLAGGKVDGLLEQLLARTGKAVTSTTSAAARAADDIPTPTAGGVYKQLEIPFVSGPVPTNPVPPRVRKPSASAAARERSRAMAEAAKWQLSLDLGDAVKRTIMPDPWTIPSTGTTPGRVNRILRSDGQFLKPEDVLDGVPRQTTTVTPPPAQPLLQGSDLKQLPPTPNQQFPRLPSAPESKLPSLSPGPEPRFPALPPSSRGELVQQLGESSPTVYQRASDIVDADWSTVFQLEGAPVRLALPEAVPPVEFVPRIEPSGQLALPLDVPSTPSQLDEVIQRVTSTVDSELDSLAYQLSFNSDDFGNTSVVPFADPAASLTNLEIASRGALPSFASSPKNILQRLGWESTGGADRVTKTFGDTQAELMHWHDNEVIASFNIGGDYQRGNRASRDVPYNELKDMYKAFAEVGNRFPDLKMTATIAAGDESELIMKLRNYKRLGFVPRSETGLLIPDADVTSDTVMIFDRSTSLIANRLDNAVTQLTRLDATRLNPIETMRDAESLRDFAEGARTMGEQALVNIESRLKGATVGRFPVASTEVRQTRPFPGKFQLEELDPKYVEFFHGTRSTADVLSVDTIRGGATSATGRGLHVTDDPFAAHYFATKPVNVDLPESTAALIGDPRVLELKVTGPLPWFSSENSPELEQLLNHVKQSFPEIDTDFSSLDLESALARVREAVSPEVAREFEIHLAEAMKDAGVSVIVSANESAFHFLDTSNLELAASIPKSSMMSASEMAKADLLARTLSISRNEFDKVDELHALHRYVNQELQALTQTEAYLDSVISKSVDKTKLWEYNAIPDNVPPVPVPDPTPPPASRVPWESTDDIGPCLL